LITITITGEHCGVNATCYFHQDAIFVGVSLLTGNNHEGFDYNGVLIFANGATLRVTGSTCSLFVAAHLTFYLTQK